MKERWGYQCSERYGCGRYFRTLKDFDRHMTPTRCLSDEELKAAGVPFLPPLVAPGDDLGTVLDKGAGD